jgi:hypothetical protein
VQNWQNTGHGVNLEWARRAGADAPKSPITNLSLPSEITCRDRDLDRRLESMAEHHDRAILGPVTSPRMNRAGRPRTFPGPQADNGANSGRVGGRATQAQAQSRGATHVAEQFGFRRVLGDHQVHAGITIEIANRRPALFTVNLDAALLSRNGSEAPVAIALEPQPAARVVARGVELDGKEVLT